MLSLSFFLPIFFCLDVSGDKDGLFSFRLFILDWWHADNNSKTL